MNTDNILPVNREHLLLMQVLVWLAPVMMCLGIGLKYVPGMPAEFFAGFYPGLGTALSIAGIRYLYSWCKVVYTSK